MSNRKNQPPPTRLDELDALKGQALAEKFGRLQADIQLMNERLVGAQAEYRKVQAELGGHVDRVKKKYALGEGDGANWETREIVRKGAK